MTTLSPELEGIIGNISPNISDTLRSPNDRWIFRLWETFRAHDFDAFKEHLKTMPSDIGVPVPVDVFPTTHPMVNEGESIFSCACRQGRDVKWLDVLFEAGSKQIQNGLRMASRCNQVEIIPWLIEHGADPMQPDLYGFSTGYLPLHHAIGQNKLQATIFWSTHYPKMIFQPLPYDNTPLLLLNYSRPDLVRSELLQYLLNLMRKHGLRSAWIRRIHSEHPVLFTIIRRLQGTTVDNLAIVKMLLSAGAEVDAATIDATARWHAFPMIECVIAASEFISEHVPDERRRELRMELFFQESLTHRLLDLC